MVRTRRQRAEDGAGNTAGFQDLPDAQQSTLTSVTALSFSRLGSDLDWDFYGLSPLAVDLAADVVLSVSSMAQLRRLCIDNARTPPFNISALAACQQLQAMHIGLPQQSPLQLTTLTYLSMRQDWDTNDSILAAASDAPSAQLRELHLNHYGTELKLPSASSWATFGAHITTLTLRGCPPRLNPDPDQPESYPGSSGTHDLSGITQMLTVLPELACFGLSTDPERLDASPLAASFQRGAAAYRIILDPMRFTAERVGSSVRHASASWAAQWHEPFARRGWAWNTAFGMGFES
ncbi:hypothetical protein WJX73_003253 [Symbiochloris irregularis]|uniref:Uncharacterized protein n=1 Tax=Symbiochloris irregularis TaxID=706552 RepID=A0AAW1Q1A7_9CHLO